MIHAPRAPLVPLIMMLSLIAGCGRSTPPPQTPPRSVKVETVRDSQGNRLPITGRIRIEQRADLSFEGSGRIASIAVDVGDTVRRGQTLARLDPEPAQLKLQQARADVSAANAQKAERELNFRQQQALFDDRVISPATLAAARAAYLSAKEQLDSAKATEALASRAVRTSAIVSPFNGRIVARSVQPFVDVTAGQSVLQIEGAEKAEVVGMLPAALVTKLKPGDVASAYTNANPAYAISIRLESLSSRLENGALVQAIFRPVEPNSELRSGEAVLITLPIAQAQSPSVPVTALIPQTNSKQASVFVYDAGTGKVSRREITPETVENGRILVHDGIAVGETVVVAGAAFLVDGQAVRLYQPATHIGRDKAL